MNPIMQTVIVAVCLCVAYLMGYLHGRMHQREVCDEAAERMRRIDPPNRTPGLPTNLDAQPSDLSRPRWRSGRFSAEPPHRM